MAKKPQQTPVERIRSEALHQFCIAAGQVHGHHESLDFMEQVRAYLSVVADAKKLARSFKMSQMGRNLVALFFTLDGKAVLPADALEIAELVNKEERYGNEAIAALTEVSSPWLTIELTDSLDDVSMALNLAQKLGVVREVYVGLSAAAGPVIAGHFETADALLKHLASVESMIAHNEALVAFAHRKGVADGELSLADGYKLVGALFPRTGKKGAEDRAAILNAMVPALRAPGVAYNQMQEFALYVESPGLEDTLFLPAAEALCEVTAPFVTTADMAIILAEHTPSFRARNMILHAFLDRHGDTATRDTVVLITAGVRVIEYGGQELVEKIVTLCREKGFDFDPYVFMRAVVDANRKCQAQAEKSRSAGSSGAAITLEDLLSMAGQGPAAEMLAEIQRRQHG